MSAWLDLWPQVADTPAQWLALSQIALAVIVFVIAGGCVWADTGYARPRLAPLLAIGAAIACGWAIYG